MSEQLKPCPFCGSEAEILCNDAVADCSLQFLGELSIEEWNKRPIEDKLRALNKVIYDDNTSMLAKLEAASAGLEKAIEFILWVSPCGQAKENPTYKLIGETARECLAELRKLGADERPKGLGE